MSQMIARNTRIVGAAHTTTEKEIIAHPLQPAINSAVSTLELAILYLRCLDA